jgi:hypothetical protein
VLHLYEARFLALLDQSMNEVGGLLAHVVFHPLDDTSGGAKGPAHGSQLRLVAG